MTVQRDKKICSEFLIKDTLPVHRTQARRRALGWLGTSELNAGTLPVVPIPPEINNPEHFAERPMYGSTAVLSNPRYRAS